MMSALATPDVQEEASANGAEAFLSKPFTLVDLRLLFQAL
jgi:CheY-like chemotaxis protein